MNSAANESHARDIIDNDSYRELPHNIEAEQALLGAVLVNNEAYYRVSDFLLPDHFFDPLHGRIYEKAGALILNAQLATPVTLKSYFSDDAALIEIGGPSYLARLAGAAVTIVNAKDYGRAVYDMAIRRDLISIGEEMSVQAYDSPVDLSPIDQIEETEAKLYDLAEKGKVQKGFEPFHSALAKAAEMAEGAFKRDGGLSGVSTGLIDLDAKMGGLQKSDLIILAARPGMGKTSLATNIAFNIAKAFRQETNDEGEAVTANGGRVAFYSLEMSSEQLATRIISEQTEISSEKIRRGQIGENEWRKFAQVATELQNVPFYVDQTGGISIAALASRARRLKRTAGSLDLIVVDYLQLVTPSGRRRSDSRVQEVSEITQGLKALAKELEVPVLALSQLSRAVEQRDDKRPILADLRESGSIEQDADVVMFIYREEYYLKSKMPFDQTQPEFISWQEEMDRVHGKAEVIIEKQRHGPTGKIELFFEERFTKFGNLDRSHPNDDNFIR
jgi:replicative DNA helicase